MNKVAKFVAVGLVGAFLASCAQESGQKQTVGTLLGAVGGGLSHLPLH